MARLCSPQARQQALAQRRFVDRTLAAAHLTQGRCRLAWQALRATRSSVLLEDLALLRACQIPELPLESDRLLGLWRQLVGVGLDERRPGAGPDPLTIWARDELEQQLDALRRDLGLPALADVLDAHRESLRRSGPLAGPPGGVLLDYYHLDGDRWVVLAVEVGADEPALGVELRLPTARLQQLRPPHTRAGAEGFLEEGAALATLCLEPVGQRLRLEEGATVWFGPDQGLALLPFALGALRPGGPALIEHHPLTLAPGPGVLSQGADFPRALAQRGAFVAPAHDLDWSAPEVQYAARRFWGQAHPLVGADAGLSAIRDLRGLGILHAATHGELRPQSPLASTLDFAGGAVDLARLVAEVDLAAVELVVLSACSVGSAAVSGGGEEWAGFPGLLLGAGVRRVVGTALRPDDAGAALAMAAFWERLAQGQVPEQALRGAMLELRSQGEPGSRATLDRLLEPLDPTSRDRLRGRYRPPPPGARAPWAGWALYGAPTPPPPRAAPLRAR